MQNWARLTIGIAVAALLLLGCTLNEAAIRKAVEETQQVQKAGEAIAEAIAGTQAALLALTPSEPPVPPTSTNTVTPEITSTSPAPSGQAYVPDLVGLNIEDAKATCSAAELPFYWVEFINKDVPEWSVFAQTPGPGGLVKLDAKQAKDKLKLLMSVYMFTPTADLTGRDTGESTGDPCGGLTYEGICDGNVAWWCDGGVIWYWECSGACGGGYCGWDPSVGNTCFCP